MKRILTNTVIAHTHIGLRKILGIKGAKNTAVNSLITIILIYSAIKIRANPPLPYSTLNPDTISDSPSAKSKGARFVSARFVINQITVRGGIISRGHDICVIIIVLNLKV